MGGIFIGPITTIFIGAIMALLLLLDAVSASFQETNNLANFLFILPF